MNSRNKGKRGERMWAEMLRQNGWTEARRGQQFAGGTDSPDVVAGPANTHAEVKFREQHDPWGSMDQAEKDAAMNTIPYVAMKKNNKRWLVVLRAEDFLKLMQEEARG